ncbi:MAG: hypothetical protein ACC652_01535 [Acidimicrobiales bacterium]
MEVVLAAIVLVIVFVIAAWAIGREARRLGAVRYVPTYRLDEAVAYVGDHLSDGASAELTYEQVREILRWHLDFLQTQQIAARQMDASNDVIVSDDPGVVYVATRASENHLEIDVERLVEVIALQLDYLKAIGAMSEVTGPS